MKNIVSIFIVLSIHINVFAQLDTAYFKKLKTEKVTSSKIFVWKPFGPGMSGYCEMFWCHPTDVNAMFMGPDMHVSYGSWDNGKSWHTIKDSDGMGMDMRRVHDIEFSLQNPDYGVAIEREGEVFETKDRGRTWRVVDDIGKAHAELVIHPTNDKIWFIGAGDFWNVKSNHKSLAKPNGIVQSRADYGYVMKTTDRGATWKKVATNISDKLDVGRLIFNPNNPNTMIMATSHGMFKSQDGGDTWTASNTGLPNNLPRDLTSYYNKQTREFILYCVEQTVYQANGNSISAKGGVYKSTDGGSTWTSITGNIAIDLSAINYATAKSKYYRAIAHWLGISESQAKSSYPTMPKSIYSVFNRIIVNPTNKDEIYIAHNIKHDFAFPPGDVWKTSDGGKNWIACARNGKYWKNNTDQAYWQSRNNPLGMNCTFAHLHHDMETQDEYQGNRFLTTTIKGDIFICIDQQTLRSNDNGKTWNQADDIETSPGSKAWIGRGDSDLPGRFILLETGVKDRHLFCSGEHGLWQTTSVGNYPDKDAVAVMQIEGQNNADGAHSISTVAVHPTDPNTIYMLMWRQTHRGKLRRSTDGGKTWENIATIFEASSSISSNLAPQYSLLIDPKNPKNMYFCSIYKPVSEVSISTGPALTKGDYGVYRSTDGGNTWKCSKADFPGESSVNRIAMHPDETNVLYAALNVNGGLYKSVNSGVNWTKVTIPSVIKSVNNVFIDKNNKHILISCGSKSGKPEEGGVWRSKNDGSSWAKIFDMPYIWQTETSPVNPDIIIVSSAGQAPDLSTGPINPGAFLSRDGGRTWTKVNKNLGQPDKIVDIKPDINDENVFWCAGWGSGWFKGRDSTGTTAIEMHSVSRENTFCISTNPITNEIKINLSKPQGIKSVSLYSINGRMIKRKNMPLSVSECTIETATIPAGCLIVLVVTNNNKSIVKKVNIVSNGLIFRGK